MVKIHVFSGFESERLKIRRDTLLGHLYSDGGTLELIEAARTIGVNPAYLQNSRGFFHFDLWGKPLTKARLFYPRVNNRELYHDLLILREINKSEPSCNNNGDRLCNPTPKVLNPELRVGQR